MLIRLKSDREFFLVNLFVPVLKLENFPRKFYHFLDKEKIYAFQKASKKSLIICFIILCTGLFVFLNNKKYTNILFLFSSFSLILNFSIMIYFVKFNNKTTNKFFFDKNIIDIKTSNLSFAIFFSLILITLSFVDFFLESREFYRKMLSLSIGLIALLSAVVVAINIVATCYLRWKFLTGKK